MLMPTTPQRSKPCFEKVVGVFRLMAAVEGADADMRHADRQRRAVVARRSNAGRQPGEQRRAEGLDPAQGLAHPALIPGSDDPLLLIDDRAGHRTGGVAEQKDGEVGDLLGREQPAEGQAGFRRLDPARAVAEDLPTA